MKYRVTHDSGSIEFADESLAIVYALSLGLSGNVVETLQDDSPIISMQDEFLKKLNLGYLIPETSNRLAIWTSDRDSFVAMLVMVNELLELGYITKDTPQTLVDINGEPFQLTTEQFKTVMVGYGMYYKQLWDLANSR